MYMAELRGKLSSKYEGMEDILTSNVFSFFKYATRSIFLKGFLSEHGVLISDEDAASAEFSFWPTYDNRTEPDLVILVGAYYLLIEAKYFSNFGGAIKTTRAQLSRELEGGRLEAKNYGREFRLIAITADYYKKEDKFREIPNELRSNVIWTNWQKVVSFLDNILQSKIYIKNAELAFAKDLYDLLERKKLRQYQISSLRFPMAKGSLKAYDTLFFQSITAKYRGEFYGFLNSLRPLKEVKALPQHVFFKNGRALFRSLGDIEEIRKENIIFFSGGKNNGQ